MVLQLEDQIRCKEKEINDLEELLKEKDERLKEAEHNSKSCLVEEINRKENTPKIQTMMRKCLYNDRGHCKFGRECVFQHFSEICLLRQQCPHQGCQKRHPLQCLFGLQCQFGPNCSFYHTSEHLDETDAKYGEKKKYGEGIKSNDARNNKNAMGEEPQFVELFN